jgi:protein-S-isoprenylcysteine O-methyltransferase Ste14
MIRYWEMIAGLSWMVWSIYWLLAALRTSRTKSSEGPLGRLQHLLPLVVGFVLIFHGGRRAWIYGWLYPTQWPRALGVTLTVMGLAFATWARLHLGQYWSGIITLKEGHRLIRSGPYRWVRHPLYTGFLTAVLGSALAVGTGDALIGFAVVLVAYLIKLRREESVLGREFGEEYAQFRRDVPAIVPFMRI